MQPVKASLLIMASALSAAALAAAEPAPKPRLRPIAPAAASQPSTIIPVPRLRPGAADERARATATIPRPQPRPETGEAQAPPPDNAPEPKEAPEPSSRAGGWPAQMVAAARADCKALLSGLDVTYTELPPLGSEAGCGAPAPIEVSAVAGVTLTPPATQTCPMAAALATWVKDSVQPAARKRLGTEVTDIRTATSYACRRRNNGSSGKMSEHSKANALDMAGFSFAKKSDVTVGGKGNWGEGLLGAIGFSKSGSFLDDIRKTACTHFTTVLGPGSDPYHGDHFHVDVLKRKGDYRICQ